MCSARIVGLCCRAMAMAPGNDRPTLVVFSLEKKNKTRLVLLGWVGLRWARLLFCLCPLAWIWGVIGLIIWDCDSDLLNWAGVVWARSGESASSCVGLGVAGRDWSGGVAPAVPNCAGLALSGIPL